METNQKSIITVFGTAEEKQAMWALKNAQAGGNKLSFSDFVLQKFGIRKPKSEAEKRSDRHFNQE